MNYGFVLRIYSVPFLRFTLMFQVGVAASYGMWAVASNFAVFVLARIIGGATKGNVSLAYSVMTDISDEKSRAKGMVSL